MAIPQHIIKSLEKRRSENQFRQLIIRNGLVDFSSNDFFGLAVNEDLQSEIVNKYSSIKDKFGGATGSRLLSGNSLYHQKLEQKLAQIHHSESALLFNSGYNANLSILSSVPQKNDTLILDEKTHASIKDGARLSFAKKLTFKHNNSVDLRKKLQKATGTIYVVVESLYSMDGDFCDINPILRECETFGAHLIVDEAHTTGIFGNGVGWCVEQGVHDKLFARIITFGKALGSFGAAILGGKNLTDYLINFARPFIYTTALPLYNLIAIEEGFNFILNNNLKIKLDEKVKHYQSLVTQSTGSYIQTFVYGDTNLAKDKARLLQENGFDVRAILTPTVPKGEEKLRICLHTFNTDDDIKRLISLLNL